MKIIFNKIITNKDTLKISLDNGVTNVEKPVSELLSNGYSFTEDDCLDLDNIQLGNKSIKKPYFTAEQNNVFKNITRWVSIASADLKAYLESMPDNTIDTPYAIKLLDIDTDYSVRTGQSSYESTLPPNKYFKAYAVKNGLTSTSGNPIKYCDTVVSLTLSSNFNTIEYSQFGFCENLREVILPDTILGIAYGALAYNPNLTSIVIPSSVRTLSYNPFSDTLKTINYRGTEEQWNAIPKVQWTVPSDCVINYNYQG